MTFRFSISEYRLSDGPAILTIYPEFIEENAGRFHRGTLWVARHGGRAIGFLFVVWSLEPAHFDPSIRRSAEIVEVHVDRKFRNRGVATSLVRMAISEAKRWGCQAVYLETDDFNLAARRVYEKCGFRPHNLLVRYKRPLQRPRNL